MIVTHIIKNFTFTLNNIQIFIINKQEIKILNLISSK